MDGDHIRELDFDALTYVDDGLFAQAVTNGLNACVRDIVDRPCTLDGSTEPRELTIKLKLTPRLDESKRQLLAIDLQTQTGTKIPAQRGGKADVRLTTGGQPLINIDSPGYFEQRTLKFEQEGETNAAGSADIPS